MQSLVTAIHNPVPVEIIRDEIRKVCGVFTLEPMVKNMGLVCGDVATRRIGTFETAIVALDAKHVQRSSQSIRHDPGEHLFLLLQDEGHCRVEQNGTSSMLTPGDMFIVDSVRPSSFNYGGERSNQISVHLPRSDMLSRFGNICTGGVPIDRQDPLWLAMRAVIAKMYTAPVVSPQLSEAFLSLLGAYFQGLRGTVNVTQTLLSRALALIERHAADPFFGPRELAGRLNVSDRMLQRHFQPIGETPGHRLLGRRLELARMRLETRQPGQQADGIASIAFDCGFNDLSYFYREFRKKYGMTPGAVLRCH
ncbi:helix-turn-helix domain-containing protein [Rhizobium sp. KVB221]|uniref:Helix-turn-helix domain-containing protein n=1 Tax=Rhizobium setariae TaxID=2801340 RepID=A0A936YRC2_9HYPH|nr:helix-turn-helix domain-containing protein [Rhizobium setariae]MBL0371142.1 helix-turn-helix domain-containing protein [Rhizobium setariae]